MGADPVLFGRNLGIDLYTAEEDGQLIFADVMPGPQVATILEEVAAFRNSDHMRSTGPTGQGGVVARVPLPLHTKWIKEWEKSYKPYISRSEFLKMRINSREYSGFRVHRL